jgi:hypothetical protein
MTKLDRIIVIRAALALLVISVVMAGTGCSPPPPPPPHHCQPGYSPCLKANVGDYDCEGGSGNGPHYTGTVTGDDVFDLDRDGDGTGCD